MATQMMVPMWAMPKLQDERSSAALSSSGKRRAIASACVSGGKPDCSAVAQSGTRSHVLPSSGERTGTRQQQFTQTRLLEALLGLCEARGVLNEQISALAQQRGFSQLFYHGPLASCRHARAFILCELHGRVGPAPSGPIKDE